MTSKWIVGLAMALVTGALVGCGAGAAATGGTPDPLMRVHVIGKVYGGQQPISGAAVYLYSTGSSGYGSASDSLLKTTATGVSTDGSGRGYVTTDATGNFDITGDYTCPTDAMVYLLAVGGNPGLSGSATNPDAVLMSAVGSCSFLLANAASLQFNVNEVTTVASVWALAPFMSSETAVGTSSATGGLPGNAAGLVNAFSTVNNLANLNNGTTPGAGQPQAGGTFAGLPTGITVPSAEIYSIANILASCINSDPSISTNCSTLFADAPSSTGTLPTNTVQAALNIAQNPGVNVAALFNLSTPTPAFANGLGSAPNDWTIGVRHLSGGINQTYNVAVDSQGNVWTANNAASTGVVIVSPSGVRLSGASGYTGGGISTPFGIAIDANDRGWVTDTGTGAGGLSVIDINGNALTGSPFTGGGITTASSPHGVAIDTAGNVWVSNQSGGTESLSQFSSTGTLVNGPIDLQGITTTSQPYGVTIDSTQRVWVTNRGNNSVTKLVNAATASSYTSTGRGFNNPFNVAIDAEGDGWVSNFGTNTVSRVSNTGVSATGSPYDPSSQLNAPAFVAVDGLDNIWVANFATSGTSASSCVTELSNAGVLLSPVCYAVGNVPGAHGLAIDTAGNLWVGGTGLTQLVGVAAPVITPLVTALPHIGVRP